jgi:ketosteroid isomerase-like protein/CheY-like chemotaxis protein
MVDRQNSAPPSDRRALLIEADDAYRAAMAECLRLGGCSLDQVASLDSAFRALESKNFDLVVWGGVNLDAKALAELRSRVDVPLLLVDGGNATPELAVAVRAAHWLPKPFVPGALVDAVRAALQSSAETEALQQWREFSVARRRRPTATGQGATARRLAVSSSRANDVTLFGPSGGSASGWDEVVTQLGAAETRFPGGVTQEVLAEHVSGDLACTVEIVCCEEMIDGRPEPVRVELRVTVVYRRERAEWKIVHRHVDRLDHQTAPTNGARRTGVNGVAPKRSGSIEGWKGPGAKSRGNGSG